MIIKMQWEWEFIDDNTQRAKVIGGWILRLLESKGKWTQPIFIADKDHVWTITKPITEVEQQKNKAKAEDFK